MTHRCFRRAIASSAALLVVFGTALGVAGEWTADHHATVLSFDLPESALVDPGTSMVYVSNIDADVEGDDFGPCWEDDGQGFISRLYPGGEPSRMRWRQSRPDATLHAPKGMCLLGGVLWIADNTRIVGYPLRGDAKGQKVIAVDGASRLNDLTSDGTDLLASDTDKGTLFRVTLDGEVTTIPAPPAINGVTYHEGNLYAVSWELHEAYRLDPQGEKAPQPLGVADHFESLDTIEVLRDGSFLVTDFQGGKVCVIAPNAEKVTTLLEGVSPADVGLDRRRNLLYVPMLLENRVEVYRLRYTD